jgi:predicted dehydrogenase
VGKITDRQLILNHSPDGSRQGFFVCQLKIERASAARQIRAMQSYSRRDFLKSTALVGAAATLPSFTSLNAQSANNKVRVGVVGVNGRGMDHVGSFTQIPGVEIAWICDVDSRALDKALGVVQERVGTKPKGAADLRKILDDKSVDAISIATPNHWHAPAAIMACTAGKHVYVEKPGSHDPFESQMIVAAARKHNRVVQQGTQRRSWPWIREAIQRLHDGVIGEVYFARAWYNNSRGTIGKGNAVPVPSWLDYKMWQGPAPEHPYTDNLLHYHWHWRWNYGNGEVGNNGIHFLDLARWGLQVGLPKRVSCTGGRYHFQDDQETPDTCVATFDFGDKSATFDSQSCDPYGFEGSGTGVMFYGTKGTLTMPGNTYKIYDQNKKQIEEKKGSGSNKVHFENFVDCIRSGKRPNADIEECQKSTMLCHLANIAYRTGHTVNFDPVAKKIIDDKAANRLWKREYRHGWEPTV